MKFFILAFALVMMAQTVMTQQYVTLSDAAVSASQLIQDLRDLGADYVAQQGVFVSTKVPLKGNFYQINKTEKVENATANSTSYYRYTVILTDPANITTANATYVIQYVPSNFSVSIASYRYTIIGNNSNNTAVVGGPSLYDIRGLNAGNDTLSPLLKNATDYVIADAIQNNKLPNSTYTRKFVYNAYLVNSGTPPQYDFLVKLENGNHDFYRLEINATEDVQGQPHVNPTYIVYPNA